MAPTTAVSPLTATDWPNWRPGSEAVSFACSVAAPTTAGNRQQGYCHQPPAAAVCSDVSGQRPPGSTAIVFFVGERRTGARLEEILMSRHRTRLSTVGLRRLPRARGRLFESRSAHRGDLAAAALASCLLLIAAPARGDQGSSPDSLTGVAGTLFFSADDGTRGRELWRSDGTTAGTRLVRDIAGGAGGSLPGLFSGFTGLGATAFFSANDGTRGNELWKSDGTTAGTSLVRDINPGVDDSDPGSFSGLTDVAGTLFFSANDRAHGVELWTSEGTTAGTRLVSDINPGAEHDPSFGRFAGIGARVLFAVEDATHGVELWKSDGTTAGTRLVRDIWPGASSSFPARLTKVGGTLFFSANDGARGNELWKRGGATAGTSLVRDITPGAGGSSFGEFTDVAGTLFFVASDGTHGSELWKSDGTAAGTELVRDIVPDAGG
jgi:ELWxxDGT repeat protein